MCELGHLKVNQDSAALGGVGDVCRLDVVVNDPLCCKVREGGRCVMENYGSIGGLEGRGLATVEGSWEALDVDG